MFKFGKAAFAAVSFFSLAANAHLGAFHEAMWCLNVRLDRYWILLYQIAHQRPGRHQRGQLQLL